jgi:Abortive infection C-terminus
MIYEQDVPDTPLERARLLQNLLVSRATGGAPDDLTYRQLRDEFIADAETKRLLPDFVRTCRDLTQFWGYIKAKADRYQERRQLLWAAFNPLLDSLEGKGRAPADSAISDALSSFDAEGVHAYWERALKRRQEDPEGAITLARTLLETVCKQILDQEGLTYEDTDDLPQLYNKVTKHLNLAPSSHTEETFRALLGNCQQVVERLGSLRNKIGDAHGKGGRPVRPSPRHAALAVNLAGAMATFLVETLQAKRSI